MKKKIILSFVMFLAVAAANAVPAHKGKVTMTQPDGTTVTITQHGDEFLSYTTTADGYTVEKNEKGYYCYAVRQNGMLMTTNIVAHDTNLRDADEQAFLASQAKMQHADMTARQKQLLERSQTLWNKDAKKGITSATGYNYDNFKGLIILVEYSDKAFTRSDANDFFNQMVNKQNYNGYYKENGGGFVSCTGSVRDYYYDNSNGIFDPSFDIVGPIQITKKSTDAGYFYAIAKEALQKANQYVNYADYDANNDGQVDMVYFIVSGYGSHFVGNNSDLLWPHASSLAYYSYYDNLSLDGKSFGRYACSVELAGHEQYPDYSNIDGIGTICHEFSHVLGLMDHYDTDDSDDDVNGESNHPDEWDIMASGCYNNDSKTPAGYNAFERYTLGFLGTLNYIDEEKEYTLNPLNSANEALRLNTKVNREYFILENRQQTGWDYYLPGHGMLIWRVDSTNTSKWTNNQVNANATHNYFELLRARNATGSTGSDPFPGTGKVKEITNETKPSLKTWSGKESEIIITNITETNKVIRFNAATGIEELESDNEPFESLDVTTADASALQGVYCKWDLAAATIVNTAAGYGNGNRAVRLERNGTLTSSKIRKPINNVSFKFWNTGTNPTTVYFATSTDGTTWTNRKDTDTGMQKVTVAAGTTTELTYTLDETEPGTRFRIQNKPTTKNVDNYIDDIKVEYNPGEELPEDDDPVPSGIQNVTSASENGLPQPMYNLSGQRVNSSYRGIVIINGKKTIRK